MPKTKRISIMSKFSFESTIDSWDHVGKQAISQGKEVHIKFEGLESHKAMMFRRLLRDL